MKNDESNYKYIKAKHRVKKEKGLYTHLGIYIVVNLIITAAKVYDSLESWYTFTNELVRLDVLVTWLVWGIVLLMHFISLKFGLKWEERKIEELMNKELSNDSK